jgi:RAD51-like protein 2
VEERQRTNIRTGAAQLDALLGGGVSPAEVTEFCGVPGVGKTQLGMQLCVNVQMPTVLGGLGAHAIYIGA